MADKDRKNQNSSVAVNSPEEKELAAAARKDFDNRSFSACIDKLKRLSVNRSNDPKIQHNMCVCHFHQTGFQQVENLKKGLKQICTHMHVDVDRVDTLDDTDHSVLYFNHAIILFHFRQHHQAIHILEKLFQVIEPLEESLSLPVLFLLAEAYLSTHQPDKALVPLLYIEKQITSNGKSEKSDNKDNKDHDQPFGGMSDAQKIKFHQLKTKCYLQLKHLKVCKRELKSVMNSSGPHPPASLFLKSNFEYLRGNYRKAIKLLNGAPQETDPWQTGESVPVMYYSNLSCVHFYMGKYHLGCHYAKRALQENQTSSQTVIKKSSQRRTSRPLHTMGISRHYELLYNTGIILLHAGRPLAAFECLIEAVQVYSSNPRLWLRLAECCIAASAGSSNSESESKGLPETQKRGIVKSVIGTGVHRKVVLMPGVSENKYSTDSQSLAFPVATLEFATFCLANALSLLPSKVKHPSNDSSSNNASGDVSETSDSSSSGSKPALPITVPAPPGPALKSHEVLNLRCSILTSSAYVSLVLGDYIRALEYAIEVLAVPGLSGSLKFLSHLYAAEALVHLDRITDAIQHMSIDNVQDVSIVYPASPEPEKDKEKSEKGDGNTGDNNENQEAQGQRVKQYHPASLQTAKATTLYNLGCAYALRTEWEKARKCLQQVCSLMQSHQVPQQALFLAIYLELQTGNIPMALQMIKKQQMVPYIKPPTPEPRPSNPLISGSVPYNNKQVGPGHPMMAPGHPMMAPGHPMMAPGSGKPQRKDNSPWHN